MRRAWFVLLVLAVPPGCGPKQVDLPRPQPGDRLTPTLYAAGPHKGGKTMTVQARLHVAGAGPGRHLRVGELAADEMPRLRVTFSGEAGQAMDPALDLPMEPDC